MNEFSHTSFFWPAAGPAGGPPQLFTRIETFSLEANLIKSSTAVELLKSHLYDLIESVFDHSSIEDVFLATPITLAPSSASIFAIAPPKPLLAPSTRATFPFNLRSI